MKKEREPIKVKPKPKAKENKTPKPQGETAKSSKSPNGKQARRRVVFSVNAEPGSEVYVAGNFNQWKPGTHPLADKSGAGDFQRQVYVAPGPLEYKFVINGEWVIDARCPAWVPNSMGSLNSLIEVR